MSEPDILGKILDVLATLNRTNTTQNAVLDGLVERLTELEARVYGDD